MVTFFVSASWRCWQKQSEPSGIWLRWDLSLYLPWDPRFPKFLGDWRGIVEPVQLRSMSHANQARTKIAVARCDYRRITNVLPKDLGSWTMLDHWNLDFDPYVMLRMLRMLCMLRMLRMLRMWHDSDCPETMFWLPIREVESALAAAKAEATEKYKAEAI